MWDKATIYTSNLPTYAKYVVGLNLETKFRKKNFENFGSKNFFFSKCARNLPEISADPKIFPRALR